MLDLNKFAPLSPASLHILIALAAEDQLHGYAIMQEVARQTGDQYKLSPTTLYDNIRKLLDHQLIEEVTTPSTDERRRFYRLTARGKGALSAEITRLEDVFRKVKSHLQPLKVRKA